MSLNLKLNALSDIPLTDKQKPSRSPYQYICDRFMLDLIRSTKFQATEDLFSVYMDTYMARAKMRPSKQLISVYADRLENFYFGCVKARLEKIASYWRDVVRSKDAVPVPMELDEAFESLILPKMSGVKNGSTKELEYYSGDKIRHMMADYTMNWHRENEGYPYNQNPRIVAYDIERVNKLWDKIARYMENMEKCDSHDAYLIIRNACALIDAGVCVCAESFRPYSSLFTVQYEDFLEGKLYPCISPAWRRRAKAQAQKVSHVDPVTVICMFPPWNYQFKKCRSKPYSEAFKAAWLQSLAVQDVECQEQEERSVSKVA